METISWIVKFYIFFSVIAVNLSTVNCQSFKRDDSRMSYAKFVRNPNTKLNALSLATVEVSSLGECTLECVNHQFCVSVNFGDKDHGRHTCELINTDKFREPDKLAASQDFHHVNIKVGLVVEKSVLRKAISSSFKLKELYMGDVIVKRVFSTLKI